MKVFNGKLTIKTCTVSSDGVWVVTANFVDNNGVYMASDVVAGDEVYANASNANGDLDCCAYHVVSVDTALTTSTKLSCVIKFDEAYSDASVGLFTPNVDDVAMICRMSSANGFAMVATNANGFSQNIVDTVRNISLAQRDVKFLEYVKLLISQQTGSDATKLDKVGGVVTGDLEVNGKLQADGELAFSKNASRLSVTESGATSTFTSATPAIATTLNGTGAVNATTSLVSTGDSVVNAVNVNAVKVASSTQSVTGKASAVLQNVVSSDATATATTRAVGDDASVNVVASGKTAAKVLISATGAVTTNVTVTAAEVQLNGAVAVNGGLTAVNDVTANKVFSTSTDSVFTDSQLTTAKYVRDYVAANAGSSTTDLTAQLAKKANVDDVYTKAQVQSMLVNIPAGSVITTDAAQFVSKSQVDAWNAKQSALGFTPEDSAKRGAANGYAALDANAHVMFDQLPVDDLSEVSLASRQADLKLGKSSKFAITGTVNGNVLDEAKLYSVTAGVPYELANLAADSKLRVPFNLISGLPATLDGIAKLDRVDPSMIGDVTGLTAGTYTSVTVGSNGVVKSGANPTTVNVDATTKKSLTIGSGFADASDVYLYADAGQVKQPFIRYNQTLKRWEFSNNGVDVFQFSESIVDDGSVLDLGLVTEAATSSFDAGSVTEGSTATYDFNNASTVLE